MGSQLFAAISNGPGFVVGQTVQVTATAAPSNYMIGTVTSAGPNMLAFNVTTVSGSGTFTSWTISTAGLSGVQGPQGTQGAIGEGLPGEFPASGEGFQAWDFDSNMIRATIGLSSAQTWYEEVYLNAGQEGDHIDFDASAAYSTTTTYYALFNTWGDICSGSTAAVASGYNSETCGTFGWSVSTSGFYWIAISTGATLYGDTPNVNDIGYTATANSLIGGRSVELSGQDTTSEVSGTPTPVSNQPWMALS